MSFLINPYAFLAAGGDFESIATVTSSGSTSTFTFNSIPQDYQHLQIRALLRGTAAVGGYSTGTLLSINGSTANFSGRHHLLGNGSSALAGYASGNREDLMHTSGGSLSNTFAAGILDILDYASTSKYKTLRSFHGADLNGSGIVWLMSNLWTNTAAITSLSFTGDAYYTGNFANGSIIALYGVKA